MILIEYPTCSTCIKAKKYLKEHSIEFTCRHIVDNPPSIEELEHYLSLSKLPIQKFFNTSGLVYKQENYKDKIKTMSEDEMILALSLNGKLIKRPLLISNNLVLVGFNEEMYSQFIKEHSHE